MRRLRVLAVVPGQSSGTSFIFAKRQIDSLSEVGCDVQTYYLSSRTSSIKLLQHVTEFRAILRELKPDLVHAHYGTMTAFFTAVASGAVPMVVSFRGSDLNEDPALSIPRAALGKLLSQLSALRSRRVICVSSQLEQKLWWRHGRTTVIPSGVDLATFVPRTQTEARELLGVDPTSRIVLFNGRERPVLKGRELVTKAIAEAERTLGPIRLVELDGTSSPSEVVLWLSAADCLAFASIHEGSPNIVKEANACNLPVISTDVGDVAMQLRHVVPSYIVPRDASRFAAALVEVLESRQRSNGRAQIEHLSQTAIAAAIRDVYDCALGLCEHSACKL